MKRFGILSALLAVLILLQAGVSVAHTTGGTDVYVRVVSANPATRTYTFSCRMDPENSYLRDWFIRPDDGDLADDPEEATFLDKPAGELLTYTFKANTFYHIACLVVDNQGQLHRGDLHINLRTGSPNPYVRAVSGNGLTSTLECAYSGSIVSYGWDVVNAQTGQVTSLGSGQTKTHSVSGHGLYDYRCHLGNGMGTQLPVEYFDSGNPYFPDNQGVPDGVKNTWVRGGGGTTTGTISLSTNPTGASATLDGVSKGTTDENGNLVMTNVASGNHQLSVSKTGYNTDTRTVSVTAGQTTNVNVVLQSSSGGGGTSYTNIQNIPATCEGGSVTQDTFNGGRQITCSATGKSLVVQAWDKPTSTNPQYFEMYKQSQTGSGLRVCLLSTCISDNGYAKSPNYPLSGGSGGGGTTTGTISLSTNPTGASATLDGVSKGTTDSNGNLVMANIAAGSHQLSVSKTGYNTDTRTVSVTAGQTTNVNVVLQSSSGGGGTGTTYYNIEGMPAACEGGSIASDVFNGGRDITCTATGKTLRVQAWDKPNLQNAQYFEMYKVSQTGSGLRICLAGNTCISDNGYARSPNYPIAASGSGGGTTTGTIAVTTTPGGASVSVDGVAKGTTTSGSSGTLSIPNIASGTHTVAVTLTGYQTYTNNAVSVTAGQTTNLNVVLLQNGGGTSYSSIQNIPATCQGGTIASDAYDGGRHITCTNGGNSLSVDGWDKPTSESPQYFELYKKSQTGTGLKLCLLSTCISDNGYARSQNYPVSG